MVQAAKKTEEHRREPRLVPNHKRYAILAPTTFSKLRQTRCEIADLTPSGIGLVAPAKRSWKKDQEVYVELQTIGSVQTFCGTVAWAIKQGDNWRIGIAFDEPEDKIRSLLSVYEEEFE